MAVFSVLLLTAAPAGQAGEAGGAFVKVDQRESLLKAVDLFLNRDNVKQMQIVFMQEALEEAKRKYAPHLSFSGVKVLSGGPRWVDQIGAAKGTIKDECTHVIVHDAARPAVPYSDIDAIMEEAEKAEAVVLAAPSRTPMVEVDEGGGAVAIRKAGEFMHVLTPQVYSKKKFEEMAGRKEEVHPSQLKVLKGSPLNVRVGGGGDATLVRAMLNLLPKPKIKAASSPFEEAQW